MNIEQVVTNGKGITHVKNNKTYKLGFFNIPKEYFESFEKASTYVHDSFDIDLSNAEAGQNRYLKSHNLPEIKKLSNEEQEKRKGIRNKALDSLLKDNFNKACYFDHKTKDPTDSRYVLHYFMHHTPDKDADLKFNQRITYLLEKGKAGKYRDDKQLDEETKKEKEELLDHYRNYLNSIENYNLDELASKKWTDEELAEHAHEIYYLTMVFTAFNDIPKDLRSLGIKDQICNDIIRKYDHYGEFFIYLETKLSAIVSPAYHLYDPEKEPDFCRELSDGGLASDGTFTDCADCFSVFKREIINLERKTVQSIFKELGVSEDKLFIVNPLQPDEKCSPDIAHLAVNESGDVTFFSEDPDYRITFNLTSGNLCKAMAQNRLSEVIEQSIVSENTDPIPVEKPNEVMKPKEIGIFDRAADFFSSIFTGHKPRQEAYNRSMAEYYQYQEELELFNKYAEGHAKFHAVEQENEAKRKLAAALKEKEKTVKKDLHQAKLAKQIKSQEIGIVNSFDNKNVIINNDKAKEIFLKEFSSQNNIKSEKTKPKKNVNIKKTRALRAKAILYKFNKQLTIYDNFIRNNITTRTKLYPLDRLAMYLLEPSDTPEAEQKNINILKKLETPEGQAEFIKKGINSIFNLNIKQLLSTDPDELLDLAENNWEVLSFAFDPSFIKGDNVDPQVLKMYESCATLLQESGCVKDIITAFTTEEYEKGTFDNMSNQEIFDYMYSLPDIYLKKPVKQSPNGPKPTARIGYVQGLATLQERKESYIGIEQKLKEAGFTGTTVKDFMNIKFTDSNGIVQQPKKVIEGLLKGKTFKGENKPQAEKDNLDKLLEVPTKDKSIYKKLQLQM